MTALFAGVWGDGTGQQVVHLEAGCDSFKARRDELAKRNLRLVSFDVSERPGDEPLWSGVWQRGTDPSESPPEFYAEKWPRFLTVWQTMNLKKFRLTCMRTYRRDGRRYWAGVWRAGTGPHYIFLDADWEHFKAKYKELAAWGLRPVSLETYVDNNRRLWAGVWREGTDQHFLYVGATWEQFKERQKSLAEKNVRLADLRVFTDNGRQLFAGVWRSGKDRHYLLSQADWEVFSSVHDQLTHRNLRLKVLAQWFPDPWNAVRVHVKVVVRPVISIDTMVERMQAVFATVGLQVIVEGQPEELDLPDLFDVNVGACKEGDLPTWDQARLFAHRDGAGPNDVVAYFVRSTIPPLNGCSWHGGPNPAVIIASEANVWTLAHQLGQVLGLPIVDDNARLMAAKATDRPGGVTRPLPILTDDEAARVHASPYTMDL